MLDPGSEITDGKIIRIWDKHLKLATQEIGVLLDKSRDVCVTLASILSVICGKKAQVPGIHKYKGPSVWDGSFSLMHPNYATSWS
jgi:hypothetical protein